MKTICTRGSRSPFTLLAAVMGIALGVAAGAQESKAPPKNAKSVPALSVEELLEQAEMDPLAIPPKSITTAEFDRLRLAWLQRTLLPAMKQEFEGALETPARLALVDQLLGWWAGTETGMLESADRIAAFAREIHELAAPSARVPVFQALAGLYCAAIGRNAEAVERWRTTVNALDLQASPGLAGLMAVRGLTAAGLRGELGEFQARSLRAALTPDQCPEGDVHFLVQYLATSHLDELMNSRVEEVLRIVGESKLPVWARQCLTGLGDVQIAWKMAGGIKAGKVTEAIRREFEEQMLKARTALTEAWKLRPDRPEAAAEMITVAMCKQALPGESPRFWFNRAIAAQCDYLPAYDKLGWSLQSVWGGSPLKAAAFGLACARVERPDSTIGEELSRTLLDVSLETGDWRPIFGHQTLGRVLVETRQKRVDRAVTPYERREQNALLALEAYLSGQFELASAALEKTGDSRKSGFAVPVRVHRVLGRLRIDPGDFVKDCRLRGGRFGEAYLSTVAAREEGETEAAAKQAAELLKDTDARQDPMLAALGPLTEFERDFAKAEWVKVPILPNTWRGNGGLAWGYSPEGLQFASPRFPARQLFHGSLGDRYEVRAELLLGKNREKTAFGVVVGATGINTNDSYTFCVLSDDGKTSSMTFSRDNLKELTPLKIADPWPLPAPDQAVAVRIRREKNELSVWLGDRLILDKKPISESLHAGQMGFGFIGFGGTADDRHLIRKLEARKLGVSL